MTRAPRISRPATALDNKIARAKKIIADNPEGGEPSPAKGMASLRRGLAQNDLRTLKAEKKRITSKRLPEE
jgi:hypothetical protein